MTRIACCAATMALIGFAAPAWAQSGTMSNGSMSNSSMSNSSMSSSMSCQDMMDKARPMMDSMTDPSKKAMAMKEMKSAKMAMDKGHMTTCKSHMKKAMGMM